VYSLSLIGDNGTFEIIPPHAVTGSQEFAVLVKNSAMLDYENHQTLNFKVQICPNSKVTTTFQKLFCFKLDHIINLCRKILFEEIIFKLIFIVSTTYREIVVANMGNCQGSETP
jgi:hypothetical protein